MKTKKPRPPKKMSETEQSAAFRRNHQAIVGEVSTHNCIGPGCTYCLQARVSHEIRHNPKLDSWWQNLDQGVKKPVGYGPPPDYSIVVDMGEWLTHTQDDVKNFKEGVSIALAWRTARWPRIDFSEEENNA